MVRVGHVQINAELRSALPGRMLAGLLAFAALALAAGAGPVRSQEAPEGPIARAEAFLAGLRAATATVHQRYHDRLHDRDVDSVGRIAIGRPDRLLVRFDDGRGFALVGTRVTAYDPEVGEDGLVHERTLGADDAAELRALLTGASTLADRFDLRELGPSESGDVLELRPRSRLGWDRVLAAIGPDGTPTRLLAVDEAGNTLRWVLGDVHTAASLPPGALTLPIPAGTPRIAP